MKKATVLMLALLVALTLFACGSGKADPLIPDRASPSFLGGGLGEAEQNQTQIPSESTGQTASTQTPPTGMTLPEAEPAQAAQQFSNDAGTSIDVLREEIGNTTARFGAAYIGYYEYREETGIDFAQWYEGASSPLAAVCPFVAEIDKNHTVGTGGHLYCVIAKDFDAAITVSTLDGEVLYRAENGDPVLVFCNRNGDAAEADTLVTVTAPDGSVCRWEPALDEMGFLQLLIGKERELLSWDFTPTMDPDFDLDGWLAQGWNGPTAMGLAYDENGLTWQISTWDGSEIYSLTVWLNSSDDYDGEAVLTCCESGGTLLAQWQGWWRIETAMELPSRLWMDLMLTDGTNQAAFTEASVVSESYLALTPQSGENLLLVSDGTVPALPIFSEGAQAAELTLSED